MVDRIGEDMEALSGITGRFAGSEGERAMLHAVRKRLPDGWLVRSEGFVSHVRPDRVTAVHVALLVGIGIVGVWWPGWASLFALLITLSLIGEATGQFSILRRVLLKSASYNLVARDARPAPKGAVVIASPLDVSRWQRQRRSGLRLADRAWQAMFWAAMGVTLFMVVRAIGEPLGPATLDVYLTALGILVVTALFRSISLRRDKVGTNAAGGAAVLLELMERFGAEPVNGVEVWIAFTGCAHTFQGGITQFLELHRDSLSDPVLVVALDEPERSPLHAVTREGPVFSQAHRATGPALVERLRWAGIDLSEVRLYGATDARAAMVRGYRSLALSGGDGPPSADAARRAADLVEVLVRWFAADVAEVDSDRSRLQGVAQALEEMRAEAKQRRSFRRLSQFSRSSRSGARESDPSPSSGEVDEVSDESPSSRPGESQGASEAPDPLELQPSDPSGSEGAPPTAQGSRAQD
ncbi:MAG: hypothetical protein EA397_14610 [Deltaproteobacteria bacterium]|nr:MAG: hypothetical protein EA397_14610 [Deltaproteobacteria bacterium]